MPRTKIKPEDFETVLCYQIMTAWQFSWAKRREWSIYGARYRPCPICEQPPHHPCFNMTDIKAGREPRINKQPHPERIDWTRILNGLKQRGYYRTSLEQLVRGWVERDGKQIG